MTRFPPLPPARLGYTDNVIDRASHLRERPEWLQEAEKSAEARFYVFCGETPVLKQDKGGADPLFTLGEASAFGAALDTVFLGLWQERPLFALRLSEDLLPDLRELSPFLVTDLRSIAMQGLADPVHLAPMAQAKAILHWHQRHGFCANCGAKTQARQAGWRRDCPACATQHFPRTDPVVIMLATDGEHCLMGRQERFPPGMYSALAGFMEPGETIAEAVRREIFEEAGIHVGKVSYLYDQPWPFPSSLMIGCLAEATSRDIVIDGMELQDARWFSREDCYAMLTRAHPEGLFCPPPLAIAHHLIRAFAES